jgi:TonB family protein
VQSEKLVEKKDETLLNLPKTNDDANKIDQEDALRRLAIERLKSLDKVSKKYQAEQSSAIAKLKQQSNDLVAGGSGISGNQKNAYISRLKAHIRPCYTLPTGYHLEKADLRVGVALVVAENGSIVSSEISEPSGDKLFDELAYKAIQNCAPLPAPPKGLAGMAILSYFKP